MINELKKWSEKLKDGRDLAHNFYFENKARLPKHIEAVAFFGMGGSGIAGRIAQTFLNKKTGIPSYVIDGPDVPGFLDKKRTLAFAMSYSGNTWETVSALEKLVEKFIPTIVLSHNGRVLEIAESKNIPFALLPDSKTPRSALGTFLGFLFTLFELIGIMPGESILKEFEKYLSEYLPSLEEKSYYKDFLKVAGKKDFFHIWGVSGDSDSCAYRSQTQFNENSKVHAVFSAFPELNHNLLASYVEASDKPLVLLFSTHFLPLNMSIALSACSEVLKEAGVTLYNPPILGDTWDMQLFNIVVWSDFASYYLSEQREVQVGSVELIDQLKKKIKEKSIR
jgi:glucose/mannose-6-phosphate isomerase